MRLLLILAVISFVGCGTTKYYKITLEDLYKISRGENDCACNEKTFICYCAD